jgi:hypothetical protein
MRMIILSLVVLSANAVGAASAGERAMELMPEWEYVADTVMGGASTGTLREVSLDGRDAVQLVGEVSLENNGGFIQMAFDLNEGAAFDASGWSGIALEVQGHGTGYELRLRTDDLTRPWQSFRTQIAPHAQWQTLRLPWSAFEAHRTEAAFDVAKLRRIGVLAIGSEMKADIAVASIGFYR